LGAALTIEPLQEGDLPFLLEVRNECRHLLHDDRSFTLEECQSWFMATRPEFWLIRLGGEPVGYFRTSNLDQSTRSIYVGADLHASFRGRGLASKAYEVFLPLLKERHDLRSVRLEVLSHNLIARGLYTRLGFVEIDRKLSFAERDGAVIDSIVMEKRL
jgi:RimJ/RimL family protein N-acetyltransferase